MKRKSLLLILLVVLLAGPAWGTHTLNTEHALADGLVGMWVFDAGTGTTEQDLTASDNDATLTGNATWGAGGVGLVCDGVDDGALVPVAGTELDLTGAITVIVWGQSRNSDDTATWFGSNSADISGGYWLAGSDRRIFWYLDSVSDWYETVANKDSSIVHCYAGTNDGDNQAIYLDGALVDTAAASGTIANSGANGAFGCVGSYDVYGTIYVGYIWNRMLSPVEVATVAAAPFVMLSDDVTWSGLLTGRPSLDYAEVAPYGPNYHTAGNVSSDNEYLGVRRLNRIRQTGTVEQMRLFMPVLTNLTSVNVKFWRYDGALYDLVGTSENLLASCVANSCEWITLVTPITGLQEGDFYSVTATATSSANVWYSASGTGTNTYYTAVGNPTAENYDWEAQSSGTGVIGVRVYMDDPYFVTIGDSIIAGHPAHYSYLESTNTEDLDSTIAHHLSVLLNEQSFQNMGIGGATTANIAARFKKDVVWLNPTYVVLEGGVNDIAGSVTEEVFIANWTAMLDACESAAIVPIILTILPWTNGTNGQLQTRDTWNAALVSLAADYSGAIVVDASSYVGQFRVGGDTENLWDIKGAYDADGTHYNSDGHAAIAQAIYDAMYPSARRPQVIFISAAPSLLIVTFVVGAFFCCGKRLRII